MLKQRKTGPFDEQLSPDDDHFLSNQVNSISKVNRFCLDNDECSSDGSNTSHKDLIFTD
jgi:hypothetical protein